MRVFQIQRFCTHDGPGIRTVVFFKGCPLRCQWCSNPESQSADAELLFDARKCIGCGRCADACPQAIPVGAQGTGPKCLHCGTCAEACPAQALESVGRAYDLEEVMDEVSRDDAYYTTGGGMTLSGGEPLMHPQEAYALARAAKARGCHVALETTGCASWSAAEQVFQVCDLILYDLKHMDDQRHRQYTGVSNHLILENLARAAAKGYPLLPRVPLIGGVNDSEENILHLTAFCRANRLSTVEFLPYHTFGVSKYALLHRKYECAAYTPSLERRKKLAAILEAEGITVIIGA